MTVIWKLLLVHVLLEMTDKYVTYIRFDCLFFIKGETDGRLGVRKSTNTFRAPVPNCARSTAIEVLDVRL